MQAENQTSQAGERTQTDGEWDVRVGRFVSRMVDGEVYRVGVKDHRFFRGIMFTDEDGNPIKRVCIIETPSNQNHHQHMKSIRALLTVLDAGERAIASEKKSKAFLMSCIPTHPTYKG